MKCTNLFHLTSPEGSVYTVPCGRCLACKINRTTEWTTRVIHEGRCHNASVFVTLTYADEFLPPNSSLSKRDIQLFLKRLRRTPRKFRYFIAGEYSPTKKRPHYHGILFGIPPSDRQLIMNTWGKGRIDDKLGFLSEQSARYCAKYIQKQLDGAYRRYYMEKKIEREFLLVSRRPGLGSGNEKDNPYHRRFIYRWLENGYIIINGIKRPIPRYYLNSIEPYFLNEYRQKINVYGYTFLHKSAQLEQKTIYDITDEQPSKNKQAELSMKTKLELYSAVEGRIK